MILEHSCSLLCGDKHKTGKVQLGLYISKDLLDCFFPVLFLLFVVVFRKRYERHKIGRLQGDLFGSEQGGT